MSKPTHGLAALSRQHIFLSHSSLDIEIVHELSRLLETGLLITGDAIFCSSLPGQGVPGGHAVVDSLWNKLMGSSIILFLVTDNFSKSTYAMCELGAVWGARKRFIPIIVPPLTYADLPGVLSITHALAINVDRDLDRLRDAIVEALPILRRKGGVAKWNAAKDRFNSVIVRLLCQFSPTRHLGQSFVSDPRVSIARVLKSIRSAHVATTHVGSFFVLMFDIDRTTQINDRFGYRAGNLMLEVLLNVVTGEAEFMESGRCGDDTFFGIFYGDEAGALVVADRVIAHASNRMQTEVKLKLDVVVEVSVSCGLADMERFAHFPFHHAFQACHSAKMSGGNRAMVAKLEEGPRQWS